MVYPVGMQDRVGGNKFIYNIGRFYFSTVEVEKCSVECIAAHCVTMEVANLLTDHFITISKLKGFISTVLFLSVWRVHTQPFCYSRGTHLLNAHTNRGR